ncbi:MAG: hypothetical protein ACKOXB_15135 [Flavobacteriales bacterium]
MLKINPIFFVLAALQLLSCKPEAAQPSYIKIDEIKLSTSYNKEGSNSSKISDAWIYVDNQLLGAFELPCEVPVSKTGNVKISIAAGIKNTGQSSIRERYLFYQWYDSTLALNGGKHILTPIVSYVDSLHFLWNFDFEGNSMPFSKDEGSDTSMYLVKGSPDVFEGDGMGEVSTDASHTDLFLKTSLDLDIPAATKATFLEMNYACSHETTIGVINYVSGSKIITPIIQLKSTNLKWNKIYIDLSTALGSYALQGKFEIYCQIHHLSNEESKLRVDNLKIISQK